MVTLSVSSSTSGSSTATGSPGRLNHLPIVASVTDSPSAGTRMSAMVPTFLRSFATLARAAAEEPPGLAASAADLKFLHRVLRVRLRNFKSKSGTRIIELLVPFGFRSSYSSVPRCITNFENRALARLQLEADYSDYDQKNASDADWVEAFAEQCD